MPRNKKNKNRNGQSTATASNTSKIGSVSTQPNSGAKNDTLNVANKIVPIQEITADQIRDNTISIDDAKSKLSQLQESVDTIKASISQLNATNENTTTELTENTGIVTDAKPFESNTVKRKRNRNRNKKKNGGGTDENSPDAAEKNTSIDQNLAQEIAEIPTVQSAEVINQSNTEQIAKSIENEIKLDLPIADKSVSKAITPVESKKSPKQTKKQNNSHGQKQDITKEKENESKDMKLSNVNEAQRNTSNQSPQQTKRRIISTEKIKSESVIVVQTEKCDKLKALEENELTIKTVPKKFEQIDVGNIKQQSATSTLEIKTETNKGQQSKEPKKSNKQKSKSDTSTIVNVSLLDSELNKELVEIKDESKSLSIEIKPEATVKSDKNSIQLIPKSAPLKNSDDNLASNANEKMSIDDPVVIATQQSVIDKITKSDPVHATKKCTNNQLIDCNLLLEAIVEKSANVALLSSDIVIKEQTSITESTPKSKQIEQEQRGQVTAMPTNELIIETLDIKKPSLQEDATSKIWKILEEASKSLEPVEIEMEDDPISSDNINVSKETTVSVSTENVESANNESEQLKSVLVPKDIETEDDKNVCSTSTSARLTEVESKKLPKMSKCESDKAPSASKEKQNETHNKNDLKVEDVISSAKIVSSDVENIVSKNETITVNTEIDAAATAKPVAEIPKIDTINLNIESAAFKAGASKSNTDSITLKSEATTSKIENITSNATKKELISSKPVETQPRKSDQKKKEHKLQKNVRTNKATQQLPPEKHPINETVPIPDIEIPLDMSIISTDGLDQPASDLLNLPLPMCDDKETTEQLSDSKNVQGSDFVPSVKQLADATKSLVTEIIISEPIRTIETKSNSPATEKRNKNEINLKQSQDTLETKIYELPEKNFAEKLSLEPQVTDIKLVDMLEAKMTEPNLNAKKQEITVKIPKPETSSAVISINKDAATDIVATPKEIEQINAKQLEQKPKILPKPKTAVKPKVLQSVSPSPKSKSPQNEKKSSNKPNVPPKPEHLISSKDKSKSPTAVAKVSNTTKFTAPIPLSDDDDEEEDFIEYKFMPRQVFICTICQSCKVPLQPVNRILCQLCQMVTYCSTEHLTNDEPSHKELCSAIQEIAKKRGGHIYNNARILNNNDYRSLRVHTLNICENLLKRPLQTYEREILLFPRLCSTTNCREWRQNLLSDCTICRQATIQLIFL